MIQFPFAKQVAMQYLLSTWTLFKGKCSKCKLGRDWYLEIFKAFQIMTSSVLKDYTIILKVL